MTATVRPGPIRIFVGCSPNNEDLESQSVLEWSLRKNTTSELDITWMQLSRDTESFWFSDPETKAGWNSQGWATPFSAFRWGIPAACDYKGFATYLDSDMIAMADIDELWQQEFKLPKTVVISKRENERFCVSLFDCARMRRHVPPIDDLRSNSNAFRTVRRRMTGSIVQKFNGNWNCCDGEHYKDLHDPDIKMLHYTEIPTQVHLKYSLPRLIAEGGRHWFTGRPKEHPRQDLQDLFDGLLTEAIANGYPPEKYRKEPFGHYATKWAA